MAFSQQTKPLGIFKILCQASKLPTKSSTIILPILLISFLFSSILFVVSYLAVDPITADFTSKSMALASTDPKSPEYQSLSAFLLEDMKAFMGVQAILITITFIVSSFIEIVTLHTFFLTCSGKLSTLRDLFFRVRNGLKGPMITKFYVKLLSLSYFSLLVGIAGVFAVVAHGSTHLLVVFGAILALFGLILYLYLAMIWSVSVVISVAEDGCYGVDAISKSTKIVRGRKVQGAVLVLIELVISGLVFAMYSTVKGYAPRSSTVTRTGIELVFAGVGVFWSLFELAVSMVFYRDCRRSEGEEEMAIDIGGFMYGAVPTAVHDDEKGTFP